MKPTLIILAAGMGSRYGSLKQIDPVGPSGETIMDYSIYDAIRAGYKKIVFVIRKSLAHEFNELFVSKLKHLIEVVCVFQEIENIPPHFAIPAKRTKPWGTGHAVLMAKDVVQEPFSVINADDFYGLEAYQAMAAYLTSPSENSKPAFAVVGYQLTNTLSDYGSVARGVCKADENNRLISITERCHIRRDSNEIIYQDEENNSAYLPPDTVVSMNFWGFTPSYFQFSEKLFSDFLNQNHQDIKSEFYIPLAVDQIIKNRLADVKVLTSPARWFGVTYKEDKEIVKQEILKLINKGIYPATLF